MAKKTKTKREAPDARRSVFISHVNDDQAAEAVLHSLVKKLASALRSNQLNYSMVYDRENIGFGEDWLDRIYSWLWNCPAAVILISPEAFDPNKNWVASEAFFLNIRHEQKALGALIPVVIGDAKEKLGNSKAFQPSNISRLKHIYLPDPNNKAALKEVLNKITETLLSYNLPPAEAPVLTGLTGAVANVLSRVSGEPHSNVLASMAKALGPAVAPTPGAVATALLLAPGATMQGALAVYMRNSRESHEEKLQTLRRLRDLLSAREVPEAAALTFAAEMARPEGEARPMVLDTWLDDITRLYVRRALGVDDEISWTLLSLPQPVLELGALDSARQAIASVLRNELAFEISDPVAARKRYEGATRWGRNSGTPTIICINVKENFDPAALAKAAQDEAPYCGILFRTEEKLPTEACCPSNIAHLLRPALAEGGRKALDEIIGGLTVFCRKYEGR